MRKKALTHSPGKQQVLWPPQATQSSFEYKCHTFDWAEREIHRTGSFSYSGGAPPWQQSFKESREYPFYARARCPATSHTPPPNNFNFSICCSLHISLNFFGVSWENNTWIDIFIRRGCRLANQQVSASETLTSKHLSSLLIGWTPRIRHVSLAQVNPLWE